jgi:hypothetical protein
VRWPCLVLGATVDPSGHRVPQRRIKAQCALRAAWPDPRIQEGVQRISEANINNGRQTKDKLAAQRHAARVGRRVRG